MAFKVGDRVVIVKSLRPERVGLVCLVISALRDSDCAKGLVHDRGMCWCADGSPKVHALNIPPEPGATLVAYPPSHLELYRDDSNVKGEWTEELRRLCKPQKVGA
jgi:hypothetical protein